MAEEQKDRFLVPGGVYRDLDGSLVHLVAIDRDLCSWVAATDAEKNRQVTHRENFRRRFRSYQEDLLDWKKVA